MSLAITAYSHLKHIGRHEKDPALNEGEPGGIDDWCHYENHVQAYAYDCFPASFRGIPVLRTAEEMLWGGCYETTAETQRHSFQAGSYGGYNAWRKSLAKQFNPQGEEKSDDGFIYPTEPDPDKPFYELIWFADNEGCIGPEAAADLLADFRQHADTWQPPFQFDPYKDWVRAFELAADGGLVHFH